MHAVRPVAAAATAVVQRTCEIWAFAFSFGWRYFLLNQKWTYPKKQGGMTPPAVSERKKELAGGGGLMVVAIETSPYSSAKVYESSGGIFDIGGKSNSRGSSRSDMLQEGQRRT